MTAPNTTSSDNTLEDLVVTHTIRTVIPAALLREGASFVDLITLAPSALGSAVAPFGPVGADISSMVALSGGVTGVVIEAGTEG